MNTAESNPTNDVLHAENPTGDHTQNPPTAKMGAGKKKMPAKPK